MSKYNLLLLNNTYDIGKLNTITVPCTMFPFIIEQERKNLNKVLIDFHGLNDTIIPEETGYTVYGSFPVIGIEVEGKMFDAITEKEIKYTKVPKEVKGLSYSHKEEIEESTAKDLLSLLDDAAIQRYEENLNRVASYYENCHLDEKYFLVRPKNTPVDSYPVLAKRTNGELFDIVTKKRIFILPFNNITSHLSRHYCQEISKKDSEWYSKMMLENDILEYINNINFAETEAQRRYLEYIHANTAHKRRIK